MLSNPAGYFLIYITLQLGNKPLSVGLVPATQNSVQTQFKQSSSSKCVLSSHCYLKPVYQRNLLPPPDCNMNPPLTTSIARVIFITPMVVVIRSPVVMSVRILLPFSFPVSIPSSITISVTISPCSSKTKLKKQHLVFFIHIH